MPDIKEKYWNGRIVKKEQIINGGPNVEFGALYEATEILHNSGYFIGTLDGDNPIAFSFDSEPYAKKWHNLTIPEKFSLDGVMVSSDFRNGDIKILYFKTE